MSCFSKPENLMHRGNSQQSHSHRRGHHNTVAAAMPVTPASNTCTDAHANTPTAIDPNYVRIGESPRLSLSFERDYDANSEGSRSSASDADTILGTGLRDSGGTVGRRNRGGLISDQEISQLFHHVRGDDVGQHARVTAAVDNAALGNNHSNFIHDIHNYPFIHHTHTNSANNASLTYLPPLTSRFADLRINSRSTITTRPLSEADVDVARASEVLSFEDIIRETPPREYLSTIREGRMEASQPAEARGWLSRVRTLTALPRVDTAGDIAGHGDGGDDAGTEIPTPSKKPDEKAHTTDKAQPTSHKRRNMSISNPLGSLRRIVRGAREPEFEMVTAASLGLPSRTSATANPNLTSTNAPRGMMSSIPNEDGTPNTSSPVTLPRYHGAPVLRDTPPIPTLRHRSIVPPSRSDLNTFIIRLQSQIADVRIENSVLRDQIMIVQREANEANEELKRSKEALERVKEETAKEASARFRLQLEVDRLKMAMREGK